MRTSPAAVAIIIAVAAIGISGAQAQKPPQSYSMSTTEIARHVARNIVAVEICGLPDRPLPFNHANQPYRRGSMFRAVVLREIGKLERLMADYGDATICDCLASGRARCP